VGVRVAPSVPIFAFECMRRLPTVASAQVGLSPSQRELRLTSHDLRSPFRSASTTEIQKAPARCIRVGGDLGRRLRRQLIHAAKYEAFDVVIEGARSCPCRRTAWRKGTRRCGSEGVRSANQTGIRRQRRLLREASILPDERSGARQHHRIILGRQMTHVELTDRITQSLQARLGRCARCMTVTGVLCVLSWLLVLVVERMPEPTLGLLITVYCGASGFSMLATAHAAAFAARRFPPRSLPESHSTVSEMPSNVSAGAPRGCGCGTNASLAGR